MNTNVLGFTAHQDILNHDTYLDVLMLLDALPRVWVILSVNLDFRMSFEQVDYYKKKNHLEINQ